MDEIKVNGLEWGGTGVSDEIERCSGDKADGFTRMLVERQEDDKDDINSLPCWFMCFRIILENGQDQHLFKSEM